MNTFDTLCLVLGLAFIIGCGAGLYSNHLDAQADKLATQEYQAKQKAAQHERTCEFVPTLKVCQR